MPRVFITQPVSASAVTRLREVAEVTMNPDMLHIVTKDELIAAARTHDVLFCLLHDHIDRDVIAANPKLKAIASTTITPADIDTAEATRRGIPVTVIPSALLDDATADLAWALVFAVGRRVVEADRLARAGVIPGSQSNFCLRRAFPAKHLAFSAWAASAAQWPNVPPDFQWRGITMIRAASMLQRKRRWESAGCRLTNYWRAWITCQSMSIWAPKHGT